MQGKRRKKRRKMNAIVEVKERKEYKNCNGTGKKRKQRNGAWK